MVLLSSWRDRGHSSRTCGCHFCYEDRQLHRMVESLEEAIPKGSLALDLLFLWHISFLLRPVEVGFYIFCNEKVQMIVKLISHL